MYETRLGQGPDADTAPVLDAALVRHWRQQLTRASQAGDRDGLSDGDRIDLLRALEELKGAAAGRQAVATAAFASSQRAAQAAAGVPSERRSRGIGAQVALARRESPHAGARHLGLALTLVEEMPHTLTALICGRITEWRATLIARETACLTTANRGTIDDRLAGTPARLEALETWSDARLGGEILRLTQELEVEALVERRRRAATERRVSGRPAPDTMMYLTALLSARDGVGALAALTEAANTAVAAGDTRTRDQIMADLLIARITGSDPATGSTPVTIDLVITDTTLFDTTQPQDPGDHPAEPDAEPMAEAFTQAAGEDRAEDRADTCTERAATGASMAGAATAGESAYLHGYGPIPAELAREIAAEALREHADTVYLRRLYAHPATGDLVALESRQRLFPAGLARFIRLRDQICRTPWCNAPIRHTDHITPHADGGPTTATNGQGLCTACNHAKQAPGWHTQPAASGPGTGGRHTVTTTTPTGHSYRSTAPPLAS